MKKLMMISLCLLMIFAFVSCEDNPNEILPEPLQPVDGSALLEQISQAGEGETITLASNTRYVMPDIIEIDKKLTISGGTNTVLDFSAGDNGAPFGLDAANPNGTFVGLVNIYADGVTLENLEIVGDADVSREAGIPLSLEGYERAFGIFISRNDKEGTHRVKETITLRNIELTRTAKTAVFAYCIYADDTMEDANALEIYDLYVHDIGELEETGISASGIGFQSGKNILVDGADIDAGDNGPAVYIHMSTEHGPIRFTNTVNLAGCIDDRLDKYGVAYKDSTNAGVFREMKNPLMIHLNITGAMGENEARYDEFLNGILPDEGQSFRNLDTNSPYLLAIDWYGIDTISEGSDYNLMADNYAARPAMWGSPVFCIDRK